MTPEDVYILVDQRTVHTQNMILVLEVLIGMLTAIVAVQVVAKIIIWRRVVLLLRETKLLVRMAQNHGMLTDRQESRMESMVSQANEVAQRLNPPSPVPPDLEEHIIQEVKKIPDLTIAKMKDSSGSVDLTPDQAGTRKKEG